MPKKVITKVSKTKASKTSKSQPRSKLAKSASALRQKGSSKTYVARSAVSGKFISSKTGRIVKASPAKPRLGREHIQTAVRSYVRRDDRTGRFTD
jgi:hypothetical protein